MRSKEKDVESKDFASPRLGCDHLTERVWCPKKWTGRNSGWVSVRAIRDTDHLIGVVGMESMADEIIKRNFILEKS